jgi:hypothetical protein
MWKYILSILIFCLVLFVYLHVNYHLKTSDDLEIYELETIDKLDEVCDLRQPVILDFYNKPLFDGISKESILGKFRTFELNVRNSRNPDYENEIYLPLQSHAALKLLNDDNSSTYISENNQDFLQESSLIKLFQSNDSSIRPGLTSVCMYDIMCGSKNSATPLRYEINYRNYFCTVVGQIEIKLCAPKYARYLHSVEDYDNFEFRSPLNPWSQESSSELEKVKFMDILLPEGKMIHIPPYWWYSIRYKENSSLASFRYRTYMNMVAILPTLGIHLLQSQNVKRRIAKKHMPIQEKEPKPLADSDELNPPTNPVEEVEIPPATGNLD